MLLLSNRSLKQRSRVIDESLDLESHWHRQSPPLPPFFKKVELYLIYSIVFVSGVQQSDAVLYIFGFFSIRDYYKTLNIVPCVLQ